MKALQTKEKGWKHLQMTEVARPEPEAGEILVRTKAASINPVDWKIMDNGWVEFPIIPGADGAGIVEATGREVDDFQPGDEIFAFLGGGQKGTHAQFFTVKRAGVALKPNTMPFELAAALPVAGLTAWQALFDKGQLQEGQRVLIHAAAGGVGHLAVQLAKWKGAEVIGTASPANHEYLRSIGCDRAVDYHDNNMESAIGQVDLVLATVGGDTLKKSLNLLSENGRLVAITGRDLAEKDKRAIPFLAQPNPRHLTEIGQMAAQGIISPFIQKTYDWKDYKAAYETSTGGHVRGKLVLRVTG